MKQLKVLTAAAVVALTGCALTLVFADDATNTPPPHHGQRGPLLEHLLAPKTVEALALTAEQKTTYEGLNAAFEKDATKWRAENPVDQAAVKQARESGDKEALRKGYIGKLRASLTDEQKTKLDKAQEEMHARKPGGAHGAKPAASTPPPAE